MARRLFGGIALAAAVSLLCACAPQRREQGEPPAAQPPAQSAPAAEQRPSVEVVVALPVGMEDMADILAQLADFDGNTLRLLELPAGEPYARALEEAVRGGTPPDLFWAAEGGAGGDAERWGQNLAARGQPPALRALADVASPGGETVYGLPVGSSAQGYLVNIEMLAALLGTDDTQGLRAALAACSYAEWAALVRTLDAYLIKPASYVLELGGASYRTPAFRPSAAVRLRGMFAPASESPETLGGYALDAALAAVFGEGGVPQGTLEGRDAEALNCALLAVYGLLDLETQYMTSRDGPVRRGEDFLSRTPLNAEDAGGLFAYGAALFLRADSREGLAMERQFPAMKGQIALVPLKFPPPEEQAAEDAPEDGSEAQSADSGSEAPPPEETAEDYGFAADIEAANTRLYCAESGALCLAGNARGAEAASSLLLWLFAGDSGLRKIEIVLYLHPFGRIYPDGGLLAQVAAARAAGEPLASPTPRYTLAKESIGVFIRGEMLSAREWDDELRQSYLSACRLALGVAPAAEGQDG